MPPRKGEVLADQHYLGHLRWTKTGSVWASWALNPLDLPTTRAVSSAVGAIHTALFRGLAGHEVLLTGPLVWTDPAAVVDKMLHDVNGDCPEWFAEVDQMIDRVGELGFAARHWSIHVRLNVSFKQSARTWARCAANFFALQAGVVPVPPGEVEVEVYRTAAAAVEAVLPGEFQPRRFSEAEMIWQRRHAQTRAEFLDPSVPDGEAGEAGEGLASAATVGEPVVDPGGISDLSGEGRSVLRRSEAPLRRRWLKIITDTGQSSWQAGAVLANVPKQMQFPEYAFLAAVDRPGVPVDVTIHAQIRSRREAMRLNTRSLRHLNDQLDQVDNAEVEHAASQMRLYDAARTLADYHALMQRDDREVEVAPLTMVSAASHESGEKASEALADHIGAAQYQRFTWARPVGGQPGLFWAGQPGQQVSPQLNGYRQITTGRSFGMAAPITQHRLGDEHGMLLAENTSSPLRSPVYLDLFGNVDKHMSCSIGILGEQGAGKTYTQMLICGATVDRGGRMIATDTTHEAEWIRFARSLNVGEATVDLADPSHSIDPLRVLPAKIAGTVVKAFLVTLLNIGATEPEGRTIAKVVNPRYLAQHGISSMGLMQRHLASSACNLPGARELADRIEVFSDPDISSSLGAAVFDPKLEPMQLDARAIVIGTSNVTLPTNDELGLAHRFKTLSPEKIFGRAIYALIARMAAEVCRADPTEDALFNIDEFHHFQSPEAMESVVSMLRYGRHDRSCVCIGTHRLIDTPPVFRGLLKNRLVMRCNTDVAKEFATFLGHDADSEGGLEAYEAAVEQIKALPDEPGHGLYLDRSGRSGPIRVLAPSRKSRAEALAYRPTRKSAHP